MHPPTRARSSTQDDDTLRTSWQSPSKLLVQPDEPHTSMSSSDLTDMMKRPRKTARRRSTLIYHLGPLEDSVLRQKKWEKIVETRLVDLFFTIHRNRRGTSLLFSWSVFWDRSTIVHQWGNFPDYGTLALEGEMLNEEPEFCLFWYFGLRWWYPSARYFGDTDLCETTCFN
jgi:hypothetical protein